MRVYVVNYLFEYKPIWLNAIGVCLWLSWHCAFGQTTLKNNSPERPFLEGLALADEKMLFSASISWQNYDWTQQETAKKAVAMMLRAETALTLANPDAETILKEALHRYPNHPQLAPLLLQKGHLYFYQKEYPKARYVYENIQTHALDLSEKQALWLNWGLSYFFEENYEEAAYYFELIHSQGYGLYWADGCYFGGYVAYLQEDYPTALTLLEQAESSEEYGLLTPIIIAQILYKQEEYARLIDFAQDITAKAKVESKPFDQLAEINLLAGDACFHNETYTEAIPFLEFYVGYTAKPPTAEAWYKLGWCYYQGERYAKAAEYFYKAAQQASVLGQSAAFYAGISYLKSGKAVFAVGAFQQAMLLNKNHEITQKTHFALAQTYYDLGWLGEFDKIARLFQEKYPYHEFAATLDTLQYNSALFGSRYSQNLDFFEKRLAKTASADIRLLCQKNALAAAQLALADGQTTVVPVFLEKALQKYAVNGSLSLQAQVVNLQRNVFAQAIDAENKKVQLEYQALPLVKALLEETDELPPVWKMYLLYLAGCTYYNLAEMQQAQALFEACFNFMAENPSVGDKSLLAEVKLRLADCYIANQNGTIALRILQELSQAQGPVEEYAAYRMAQVLLLQPKETEAFSAIDQFQQKYPKSIYLYELWLDKGKYLRSKNRLALAIQDFTQVCQLNAPNYWQAKALLLRAQSYYALGNTQQAIADASFLLQNLSSWPEASDAFDLLDEILTAQNRTTELREWNNFFQEAFPPQGGVAMSSIAQAQVLLTAQNYSQAIPLLKNALADSPTNSQNAQVACWLGEAYAHLNDPTQALRFFDQLTQKNITPFTVQAALSASQVLQKQGDWNNALKNSRKAMAVAHQTEQQMEALYGMAKSYFALSLFDSSAQATRQLIEAGQFRNPYYNKAILLNAQLFLAANLDPQAKGRNVFTHLEELIQNTGITSESTEALYLTAELKAKQGNWEACANILYQLFTTCAHYTYWNERAWLLLADAFVGMENPLQARSALLHLNITSQNTEILESAREKLIILDAQNIP